ncbi:MAG: transcription elongation factor GreA [Treponema sp.]|jgi:transcription elongation factor GreA|nr:transcription elongation factor GreA [Treponema sp.]
MSDTLIKNVHEMLNQEKWTRSALTNYSITQFKELDSFLKEAKDQDELEKLKEVCDEHLNHTRNSISALYLSGMIALSRRIIDDSTLVTLVGIFTDNRKWTAVKYLCERMLEYGESRFALRTLADCYKNDHDEPMVASLWERIVKVDPEEADLAKALAEYFEKESDIDRAIEYFKKALHRYINKQALANIKDLWEKLLDYCPEDIDFFIHVQKKIAKTNIGEEKKIQLLECLYYSCRERKDIDTAITVLKLILEYDERNSHARKEIAECFRIKYANHSQLEQYIRVSNLLQSYRNVHEAIADFEKHIAFDRGNYVFHRTWGVGRINTVQGDDVCIDFAKKRGHTMSLQMAVDALQILSPDHIWVLKATWKKEKLYAKVKKDIAWTLKTVIKSFDNLCDMKRVKAELVPHVLFDSDWPTWNSAARQILKNDLSFGVSQDSTDVYTVREHLITVSEKLYNEFKVQKKFFKRIVLFRMFLSHQDFYSEYFNEMLEYFTHYFKEGVPIDCEMISSFLFIESINTVYPDLAIELPPLTFLELFNNIKDVSNIFINMKDSELRKSFLEHIYTLVPQWTDVFISLFPAVLEPTILEYLNTDEYKYLLVNLTRTCFEKYREYSGAVVWLFKNSIKESWYREADIPYEKQLITLINILDHSYKEIENHHEGTENRKINRQVEHILFKDDTLITFIDSADEKAVIRIFTLLSDIINLDPTDVLKVRNHISKRYPDLKFVGDTEKTLSARGLLVTATKYEEKQRQLSYIMEKELPANTDELKSARELGDLRENAEYKAAKEKQEYLNFTAAKLKKEIEQAQIFDVSTVVTSRVSFGTKITLRNNKTGVFEEYTILGPWESDPEHRIISYLSPFGSTILNKKPGEHFEFSVTRGEGEKTMYTVETINIADL